MATLTEPTGSERAASAVSSVLTASLAFVLPLGAGFAVASAFVSSIHNKNFPWVTGRALGIAGYLALSALVALGLWMRHPWRFRLEMFHPETRLRAHATLGVATIVLILGHLVCLASDHYAGVGWVGAILPGLSHYRRAAVGLGVGAFELLLVIAATARFAGRRGTKHWLTIHRLASATFALTWFHGVLAGTDTSALRLVYVVSGTLIASLIGTRVFARRALGQGHDAEFVGTAR